jgi:hypothetical protein
VKDAGVMYIPFVFDVYGTLNGLGHQCLQRISSIAARKNGKNCKNFYGDARSKLHCAVLSSTARQLMTSLFCNILHPEIFCLLIKEERHPTLSSSRK